MPGAVWIGPEAAASVWPHTAGRCADCQRTVGLGAVNGRCRACIPAHTARTRALWAQVKTRARARARASAPTPGAAVPVAPAPRSASELARQHGGDPWVLAEAIGARVQWGDGAAMVSSRRPTDGLSVRNPLRSEGPHLIVVANTLHGGELEFVLLHEVGHLVLDQSATEDECDAFAFEFMLARQLAGRESRS